MTIFMYDVSQDLERPATQKDFDRLNKLARVLGQFINDMRAFLPDHEAAFEELARKRKAIFDQ